MAETILGKVCPTPKGVYNATAKYEKLDIIQHDGNGYMVLKECTGVLPSEGEYYMLLSARGSDGTNGTNGTDGAAGTNGADGKSAYQAAVEAGYEGTETEFGVLMNSIDDKQDKLTGSAGQIVEFDSMGLPHAGHRWSNPNLLDNWYFADPINQRRKEEYNARGYTIDRWVNLGDGNLTVSLLDGCVHLSSTAGGDVLWVFSQPFTMNDSGRRPGITMTLSFLAKFTSSEHGYVNVQVDNDTQQAYHVFAHHSVVLGEKNIYSLTFSLPETWSRDDYLRCTFYSCGMAEVDLYAAKLEFGARQTLAHQDENGNWVLNDPPPNRALELLKCQRYQYATESYYGAGEVDGEGINIGVNFPCTMRSTPTMQAKTGVKAQMAGYGGSGFYEDLTVSFRWGSPTSCSIVINVPDTSKFVEGHPATARIDTPLLFDANL